MKTHDNCANCGHPKEDHWVGLGRCRAWDDDRRCLCSHFLKLQWDKKQIAKVGTQPAVVRFRRHTNPTRWSVNVGRIVEFRTEDDKQAHTGIVDKISNGVAFINLF